jgi:peptidoglycan/LPS O-acetylase OafA/YrhL
MSASDVAAGVAVAPMEADRKVSAGAAASRFQYIDGLRGVASMMVAVGHLGGAVAAKHPDILGATVHDILDYGRYGVHIFFLLSGFVIAHSVITGAYSFGYLGRFIGRRFVRLDVPYWTVIALELVLLALSGLVMAQYERELPSLPQIAANMFYLQQYLGYEHISPVFWTLCYEVQFYVVFVLCLVLLTKLRSAGASPAAVRGIAIGALALSFIGSLAIYVGLAPNPHHALFVDRWFQFALGVITYLYYRGSCGWRPFAASVGLCVALAVLFSRDAYHLETTILTAATAVAILASVRFALWNSLLIGPAMQFFGRISYSLYLLHLPIGWRAIVVARELLGTAYTPAMAWVVFAFGIAVSVFASWIMYLLIEGPAIKLARKIRLPQRQDAVIA